MGYGTPRVSLQTTRRSWTLLIHCLIRQVGTETFVDWVDTLGIAVNHVANKKDLVPILPPMLLGFRQISGEIHIDELNQWINCPGMLCTI